jgi:signal transduction histidine kinase/CheY-like chemotaxis protein
MTPQVAIPAPLLARARADQVATLYRSWHRTTASMVLGAAILCTVLWGEAPPLAMASWFAAILANQAWRGALARAYRRARPAPGDASDWGRRWAAGSTVAGALWGVAAVAMYPASAPHQGLLIVCLFGVILGGLNLTAVYKPSFYGFVLPAIVPLIVRVAADGSQVHLFTALVMSVVLAFVLAFGHQLNGVLTHSLAIRYENIDLIGELQAQTAVAVAARAAAESADRAKSQFLAAASHDLRQPLHALGLFAAALARKTRDSANAPLVASLQASIDALEDLFAQLLDLSRLDAGALRPVRGVVALEPLFERLAADFAVQGATAGVAVRIVPTRCAVDSDPVLLERILRNLVGNAVRYTRAGGIVIGVRRQSGALRIDVVDSGIGIAEADRARIFDEFVQIGAAPRAAGGRGLGLGLAIVRRLADLLGHRLELVSRPGRGSRFSVHAPRAATGARTTAAAADTAPARDDDARILADRHVVLIDDDPAVVAGMDALFTAWGARVSTAAGADEAVAAIAASVQPVDLVVADLRLADDACGVDAIAAVRSAVRRPVPALVVTGDAGAAARAAVAAAGLPMLSKPVVGPALLAAARRALEPAAPVAARAYRRRRSELSP